MLYNRLNKHNVDNYDFPCKSLIPNFQKSRCVRVPISGSESVHWISQNDSKSKYLRHPSSVHTVPIEHGSI